jgi:ribosome-binding protein aMBF1 (putative translation factor)
MVQGVVREILRAKADQRVSQAWLAAQLSLRPNTVGAMERGETWPGTPTLLGACAVLGIDVAATPPPDPLD